MVEMTDWPDDFDSVDRVNDAAADDDLTEGASLGVSLVLETVTNQRLAELTTALESMQKEVCRAIKEGQTSENEPGDNNDDEQQGKKLNLIMSNRAITGMVLMQGKKPNLIMSNRAITGMVLIIIVAHIVSGINGIFLSDHQRLVDIESTVELLRMNTNQQFQQMNTMMESLATKFEAATQSTNKQFQQMMECFLKRQDTLATKVDNLAGSTSQRLGDMNTILESFPTSMQALIDETKDLKQYAKEEKADRQQEMSDRQQERSDRQQAEKMRLIDCGLAFVPIVGRGFPNVWEATEQAKGSWYKYSVRPVDMEWVLQTILLRMKQGNGHFIDRYFIHPHNKSSSLSYLDDIDDKWYQVFRDKLSDSLHQLIGKKPRFSSTNDGHVAVYYE